MLSRNGMTMGSSKGFCMTTSRSRAERPTFEEGSAIIELDRNGLPVSQFRCGVLLGRGGFAKCYEVFDASGASFALKVVERTSLLKTKTLQKLHSEIAIHRRMKHKHIVAFIRTFHDEWFVYILLEKCGNHTLMDLSRRRKRFTVEETQYIMLQCLSALQYMHDNNIIHRDLKLGNIMMDDNMNVKVGDFGLAAELQYDGERKRTICGTPNYIAPEIIEGKSQGHSYEVDIWSLGVILYTLLVGEPPFQTENVQSTYTRIKKCLYEFPADAQISESGQDLIHRILQSKPECRPNMVGIRSHAFFHDPSPPTSAPASLFLNSSRRRAERDRERQRRAVTPAVSEAPLTGKTKECVVKREVLRPINTNAREWAGARIPTVTSADPLRTKGDNVAAYQVPPPPSTKGFEDAPMGRQCDELRKANFAAPVRHAEDEVHVASPLPQPLNPRPRRHAPPIIDVKNPASMNLLPPPQMHTVGTPAWLDDEERQQLTNIHDKLQKTLCEADPVPSSDPQAHYRQGLDLPPPPTKGAAECAPIDKDGQAILHSPTVWVTDYANFSGKYGLCYRLSTGHTGVLFNDATKMVWEPVTGRVEYYKRVKEVVHKDGQMVVHAKDQRHPFSIDQCPEDLRKKVLLIEYFKSYLSRVRSIRDGVEVVRCSPFVPPALPSLNSPHMVEDMVYMKRWIQTQRAMIFRLSSKEIQVCFDDMAEVIINSESRHVTYTDAAGNRQTVALSSFTTQPTEIVSRMKHTMEILCELIQKREL